MTSTDNKNAGKPWTKEEDELLLQLYNVDKLEVIEIAKLHQRATGGIISRIVKNKIVQEKKLIRGYDSYLKIEQSTKPDVSNEKSQKNYKVNLKKEDDEKDELILVGDTEYILNDKKVYEIKKVKGQIYGHYDENTCAVKALKPSIRKIITYLSNKTEIGISILWAGSDLSIIQSYLPNLLIKDINELKENDPIDFSICICNNYIGQIESTVENQIDVINQEITFICNLLGTNGDLLLCENKDLHEDILALLIQNNFKITEQNAELSNKTSYLMGIKKPVIEKFGIMVLDTETTGFPNSRDPKDFEKFNSARLIELGYIVYDASGKKIKEYDSLVKPDNWTITNSFVHGISQSDAMTKGKPLCEVLADLSSDLNKVQAFVCHNISFDMDIILAEAYRLNKIELVNKIDSKQKICTMDIGKKFMKLNKKPKLVELYKFLFKQEFKQDHRALSDCVACADCFYNMTC